MSDESTKGGVSPIETETILLIQPREGESSFLPPWLPSLWRILWWAVTLLSTLVALIGLFLLNFPLYIVPLLVHWFCIITLIVLSESVQVRSPLRGLFEFMDGYWVSRYLALGTALLLIVGPLLVLVVGMAVDSSPLFWYGLGFGLLTLFYWINLGAYALIVIPGPVVPEERTSPLIT